MTDEQRQILAEFLHEMNTDDRSSVYWPLLALLIIGGAMLAGVIWLAVWLLS